jgi:hypothetical protein
MWDGGGAAGEDEGGAIVGSEAADKRASRLRPPTRAGLINARVARVSPSGLCKERAGEYPPTACSPRPNRGEPEGSLNLRRVGGSGRG